MDDYQLVTTVIYDGECDFCKSCIAWVQSRCVIKALPNQSIDPRNYGITREQCEKSVVVIDTQIYFGAKAVAQLLEMCGYNLLAIALRLSGPIGEFGYRYVANHRDGHLVALMHCFIRRTTK